MVSGLTPAAISFRFYQNQYSGGWQWCCQRCFDLEDYKDSNPTDYATYDAEEGKWLAVLCVSGAWLWRHLIHPPHAAGNLTQSCGKCAPKKLRCISLPKEMRVVFDDNDDAEERMRAGFVVARIEKMSVATRCEVLAELEKVFERVVCFVVTFLLSFQFRLGVSLTSPPLCRSLLR